MFRIIIFKTSCVNQTNTSVEGIKIGFKITSLKILCRVVLCELRPWPDDGEI